MVDVQSTPRTPAARWPWLVAGLLVLVAAGWSAAWFFLAGRVNAGFDTFVATEAAHGRVWTCPARHVGGFPFAIKLRCDRPTYHGEVAGRTADGIVEGLIAEVRLDHPRRLSLRLRGPLNLRSEAEDFDLAISWEAMDVAVDDLGAARPRGTFDAARLAITLETRRDDLNLRMASVEGDAAPVEGAPDDAAFTFAAKSVVFPTLEPLPGLDAPTDADGRGVLHQANLLRGPTRARLEAWRQAGGSLSIAALEARKGTFHGSATGELALDDDHKPAGKLDASLAGFEPIAQHFGIPVAGLQLGGLLSTLLGGAEAAPAAPGDVRLQLVLDGGGLFVGPFKTGVRLDPFY